MLFGDAFKSVNAIIHLKKEKKKNLHLRERVGTKMQKSEAKKIIIIFCKKP